jgi:hypothetical protein
MFEPVFATHAGGSIQLFETGEMYVFVLNSVWLYQVAKVEVEPFTKTLAVPQGQHSVRATVASNKPSQ